jgi:Ig domain of plant-specific actin-binding protein
MAANRHKPGWTLLSCTAAASIVAFATFIASGGAAPQQAPAITSAITISGTARVGETLTASPGTWTGTQPITFVFQWRHCDASGSGCSDLGGATGPTYVVQSSDLGGTLRVSVTATNTEGSNTATSAATDVVVPAGTAPAITSAVTISGTAREGATLTVNPGTWTGTQPITFSYQWIRCSEALSNCQNISGATNSTYVLTSADVGKRLIVSVRAANVVGANSAQAATPVIAARGNAPAATALPSIAGTSQAGATLTASPGTWTGTQPITFAYRWLRCDAAGNACSGIPGATARTFQLGNNDVNRTLRVQVTAKNAIGSKAAISGHTAVIRAAGPAGQIRLPNGRISIPITSVSLPARLIISRVAFSPNPVRSRQTIISLRVWVTDTRGYVIRGALVFARSTPLLTSGAPETATQQDGSVTLRMTPRSSFPLKNGYNVQFFVRARKPGENVLGGVSTRRLVQVRTANPA